MICPNCGYKTVIQKKRLKSQNELKTTRKILAQRGTDVQVSTALERLQLFQRGRAGFYIGNARRVL
jgi:hypothetical protein